MTIKENIIKIKDNLADAMFVVAVKYVSLDQIKEVIDAGVYDLGFNTYQQLRDASGLLNDCRIHFIGHLQKNKVKKIIGVYLIHSVDSYELVKKINEECAKSGIVQNILLQVKTDDNKEYGFSLDKIDDAVSCVNNELDHVNVCGLMTIPPIDESKKYFELMKKAFDRIRNKVGDSFMYLSMGMSSDYKVAIEEGANIVRIGRAVFE